MSNETKRDVFEYYLEMIKALKDPLAAETVREARQRYADTLPDDLPVIPELISKYLKMWKHDHGDLFQAFDEGTSASLDGTKWESVQDWFSDAKDSFDTFALAWLLGVWRVEETGEIVKLEAEK
ncbi:hypothetical protein FAM19404_02410 [Lacticaseibacillus paracasei]|uniref:hypothetical protein n=1 Tax=Lacticaseibacillus paracasei TaxID=1597 RepID=UPI000F43CD3B|nr:hypothetical protein [Lacticaseibacillus paracasei]RND95683.1 hypothetical protein FAM19404_02410 [Lacticaseibacillus paracasei]